MVDTTAASRNLNYYTFDPRNYLNKLYSRVHLVGWVFKKS